MTTLETVQPDSCGDVGIVVTYKNAWVPRTYVQMAWAHLNVQTPEGDYQWGLYIQADQADWWVAALTSAANPDVISAEIVPSEYITKRIGDD